MQDFHLKTSSELAVIRNADTESNKRGYNYGDGDKSQNLKHIIGVWGLGIVIAICTMFIQPLVEVCKDPDYDISPFLLEESWQINGILIFISATMAWSKKFVLQKLIFYAGIAIGILALIVYVILLSTDSINEILVKYLNVIDFCILLVLSVFEAVIYLVGQRLKKGK